MKTRTKMIFASALLAAGLAAPAVADPNYWVSLGKEHFAGRNDREASFPGWGGRSIEKLGLRANDFARCSRVRVTFGNGKSRDLDSGDLKRMVPGRTYKLDLPGDSRNVTRIALACHSLVDRSVAVEVFAQK
jgi:hypothetical protein